MFNDIIKIIDQKIHDESMKMTEKYFEEGLTTMRQTYNRKREDETSDRGRGQEQNNRDRGRIGRGRIGRGRGRIGRGQLHNGRHRGRGENSYKKFKSY